MKMLMPGVVSDLLLFLLLSIILCDDSQIIKMPRYNTTKLKEVKENLKFFSNDLIFRNLSSSVLPKAEENPLRVLDRLLKGYDRRSTPLSSEGAATLVWTQLYIASLGSINTENMVNNPHILHEYCCSYRVNIATATG